MPYFPLPKNTGIYGAGDDSLNRADYSTESGSQAFKTSSTWANLTKNGLKSDLAALPNRKNDIGSQNTSLFNKQLVIFPNTTLRQFYSDRYTKDTNTIHSTTI